MLFGNLLPAWFYQFRNQRQSGWTQMEPKVVGDEAVGGHRAEAHFLVNAQYIWYCKLHFPNILRFQADIQSNLGDYDLKVHYEHFLMYFSRDCVYQVLCVRNGHLFSLAGSLCTRMLGQSPGSVHASTQCGMCPLTFFTHYPSLLPFLLAQLRDAALDLQDSSQLRRLCVHPSLYPVLTLLAKLQPGLQTETRYSDNDWMMMTFCYTAL